MESGNRFRPPDADKPTMPEVGPEAAPEQLSQEKSDQAEHWLKIIEQEAEDFRKGTALLEAEKEKKRGRMTPELRTLFDEWLDPEKLAALHALTTEREAMDSELRQQAKLALTEIPINHEAWPGEDEIMDSYVKLSQAVGMINGGKVDHTRTPWRKYQ